MNVDTDPFLNCIWKAFQDVNIVLFDQLSTPSKFAASIFVMGATVGLLNKGNYLLSVVPLTLGGWVLFTQSSSLINVEAIFKELLQQTLKLNRNEKLSYAQSDKFLESQIKPNPIIGIFYIAAGGLFMTLAYVATRRNARISVLVPTYASMAIVSIFMGIYELTSLNHEMLKHDIRINLESCYGEIAGNKRIG